MKRIIFEKNRSGNRERTIEAVKWKDVKAALAKEGEA